ncbi:recombinase RecT [Mycobacterium sp. PSTR-4-N]|uniref:recombinase RecT n=1 Tax=Mycobacterium sp. PSTR-4-N TaxID=2917745 RepID=UPI001F152631|nr:recombinase RecT [Mycobacterium sp. PSTR-4-N]MCG7592435.1 recombinase RecT [Mycobacterium sp. PSTR-4-N]
MTETTTAEQQSTLLDAVNDGGQSLATIRPGQQRWDDNQLAILRAIGVEDATQADVDLFFHYCRTTGLDPFRKQIYMIGRNTKLTEWVEQPSGGRTKVEKWVTKYTIQIGIDGYRKHARNIADALGDQLSFDGPYWCGEDGQWREVWTSDEPPAAAKYIVFRNGEPHTGIAKFSEYVQTNAIYEGSGQQRRKVGEEPNSMWSKMPSGQIGKCAEALAYRRAFPDDFSGLILEGTDQPTVIDPDGATQEPQTRRGGSGIDGLRGRAQAAQQKHEVINAEVDPEPVGDGLAADQGGQGTAANGTPPPSPTPDPEKTERKLSPKRKALEERLSKLIAEVQPPLSEEDQALVFRSICKDTGINAVADLADGEVGKVSDQLFKWSELTVLNDRVRDIVNAAVIAAENAKAGDQ